MNKTLVMIVFVSFLVGCTTQVPDTELKNNLSINNTQKEPFVPDVTELQIDEIEVGTGDESKVGDSVSVHYTGRLTNGTKFDSSVDRGTPFSFQLGAGEVIQGWDLGVAGMKVGGIRKLTIPSDLAYGPRSVGSIPANSTLVFEVELLEIQ